MSHPTRARATRADCAAVLDGRAALLDPLRGGVVYVTGGGGFVGAWLAEMCACLNDDYGFGVRLILSSRRGDRLRAAAGHLLARDDIEFQRRDVRSLVEFPAAVNWVIHAAGSPDNREHATKPLETMSVIADGAARVIQAAGNLSALRMALNVSSGLVYGPQPAAMAALAEDFPGAPASGQASSAYAEAKRYGETLCAAGRSQLRLPVATVRPFSFLGPYQPLDRPWAINDFLRQALSGQTINVLGDGRSVRGYMYAADMAFWMLRVLTGARSGQIFNLGHPEPVTLEQAAMEVARAVRPSPEIRLNAAQRPGPVSRLVPDVSFAADELGLTPTVSFPDAVARTVAWHRLPG